MTSYWQRDIPAAPLAVPLVRDGQPIDVTPFTSVDVTFFTPGGIQSGSPYPGPSIYPAIDLMPGSPTGVTATIGQDEYGDPAAIVHWSTAAAGFKDAGLYVLQLTLQGTAARRSVFGGHVVIQERTAWHSLESARAEWADAPEDDAVLFTLLDAARDACATYAPAPKYWTPVVLPRIRQAHIMQTRNLWNASKVDPGGSLGSGDFTVAPRPLDWQVTALLRPKQGKPVLR